MPSDNFGFRVAGFLAPSESKTKKPISIFQNSAVNNRPQHKAPGNKPTNTVFYSPEVYCLHLSFKISKLRYHSLPLRLISNNNYYSLMKRGNIYALWLDIVRAVSLLGFS